MYRDEIENYPLVKGFDQGRINVSENETVKFSYDYAQINNNPISVQQRKFIEKKTKIETNP